jgi:hypothetical protein
MTIEISAFGLFMFILFLLAPDFVYMLAYIPLAIAGWVIDGVCNLFLGPKDKGGSP